MKYAKTLLTTLVLLVASTGSAQVVLPDSSEYRDPYTYFRDCVDRNGSEQEGICEQQTGALFPEAEPEAEAEFEGSPDSYALSNEDQQN